MDKTIRILLQIILKNITYRKRRLVKTIIQILTPIVLFLSFSLIRSKIDNLEKVAYETFHNPEYSSEHLYNDKFDHETKFYYTPCNQFTSDLMYSVQIKFYLNIMSFKCYEDEVDLLRHTEFNDDSVMAIIFKNLTKEIPNQLSYEIRPYQKHVNWETKDLYKTAKSYTPDLGSSTYLYQGLLAVQMALETSYIELVTNKELPVTVMIQEFPYPPHTDNSGTMDMFNYVLPLATVLSFTSSCAIFLPRIIEDKVSGMKEFVKLSGVSSWIISVGWFFDEFSINIVITGIIMLFLKLPVFSVATPPIEHCDSAVLFTFLTLYSVSTISFSMALSLLINKPAFSVIISLTIWILSFIIPNSLVSLHPSVGIQILYGIFPNGLLAFGFKILAVYENRGTTTTWSNLFTSPSGGSYELTMGMVFVLFFLNTAFFLLIAFFGEQYFPGPYGVPKRLSISKLMNLKISATQENQAKDRPPECAILMEGVSSTSENCNLPVSITIKNLSKRFGNKTVVDNVTIDIYNEQITVLLGRNGAGKTTMLSMITGMLNPTEGSIQFPQSENVAISFCPQHNLHFSSLTVVEHIRFFGKLRDLSNEQVSVETKELLELTGLTSKKNELVHSLSEGMQRKLLLSLAVIGNPTIIVLDEPSSGLDPEVRRDIWKFIVTLRGYRTVIVTTHLMEEAEAISDRIIIVDKGTVIEYGSPLYLSKKYGVGYKISVFLDNESNKETIENAVKNHGASTEYTTNLSMTISVDKSKKEKFFSLLQELEEKKNLWEIKHLLFSQTTLEDVFLNVMQEIPNEHDNNVTNNPVATETTVKNDTRKSRCKILVLFKKWKNFTYWRIHFVQLIVLMVMMLSLLLLDGSKHQTIDDGKLFTLNLNQYGKTTVFYSVADHTKLNQNISDIYSHLIQAQNGVRVDNVTTGIINEGLKNIEFYKMHMVVSAVFEKNTATALYSNGAIHGCVISLNLLLNAVLKSLAGQRYSITAAINPLPYQSENEFGHIYTIQLVSTWCILLPLAMVLVASLFIIIPQMERLSTLKQLQLMCGVSRFQYWFTCYVWNFVLYFAIISVGLASIQFINETLGLSEIFKLKEIVALFVILMAFGVSVLPYTYLYTYRNSTTTTLGIFVILNLLISTTLMIFFVYLKNSDDDYLEKISAIFAYIFNLFPVFGLQYSISELIRKCVWNYNWKYTSLEHKEAICKSNYNPCCENDVQKCDSYQSYLQNDDIPIVNNISEMLLSSFIFVFILMLTEARIISRTKKRLFGKSTEEESFENDSTDERNLEVNNLCKKLGNKDVVKNINFRVGNRECLGLLGANGAGKTTISRLLAKEEIPDRGKIKRYSGSNSLVLNEMEFGYCPQVDCSTPLSSGRTILELFGELRGVEDPKSEVTRLINTFELNDCVDKTCDTYSGGNKRKLGTAIALIGTPDFIVLDESTSGVDLISRQKIRNEIKTVKEKSSVIISTHIIEDCEILCNKIVILKHGEIIESGSITDLKSQINQSVTVKLNINSGISSNSPQTKKRNKLIKELDEWNMEESEEVTSLKNAFKETFKSSNLKDQHVSLLKYNLAVADTTYNTIFRKVESLQRQHSIIEDYEISMTTLEDVFLSTITRPSKISEQEN